MFGRAPGSSVKRPCSTRPILTSSAWCADVLGPHRLSDRSARLSSLRIPGSPPCFAVPFLLPCPAPSRRSLPLLLLSVMGVPEYASPGRLTHSMLLLISLVVIQPCFRSAAGAAILTKGFVFPHRSVASPGSAPLAPLRAPTSAGVSLNIKTSQGWGRGSGDQDGVE
ncbi:hypothetical protein NDU88_002673 [Pleurodeles waltl]|uniref:Uncharacterized protein n=1 Tax=Pleurodeles waltl TaxID=8319 RepID=A0AAV7TLV4_PLEWA|nr:hypothetical protein NDU88_002673 [Pleurodeles waltl]